MKDILVGASYFAGWWEPLPNKWHRHASSRSTQQGDDWRSDFPERVPLLGCYNNQETMDKEIQAAADHGVDFFPILWYYMKDGAEPEPNSRFLNRAVGEFGASPHAHHMHYFIEFCNHPPFEVTTHEQWDECLNIWKPMIAHPSYLRVGDKLVFKIHGAQHFINQNGGDINRCRAQIDSLRNMARSAGLGEMLIGGGVMALGGIGPGHPVAELFDFTCTYMDLPDLEQRDEDYPYETLADLSRAARHIHCRDAIPYVPYLPAGWCPRPWPDRRAYFQLPDSRQWTLELRRMKEDLRDMPNLGFPLPDGSIHPAFTCYAWNEYGEGGIIAPTVGDGYMKLEGIKSVFAS